MLEYLPARRTVTVGVVFALVLGIGGAATAGVRALVIADASTAKIVFVDVGQGDGVVMKIGSKIIVSDAGEFELENVNAALKALEAKRIDVAILSHPHKDHVKNFIDLFATWEVKKAVMSRSDYWQGTQTNRAVMAAIADEGLQPTYVHSGRRFTWGGASWRIVNPPEGQFTANSSTVAGNASVAYLLRVNGVELLFTGDIEKPVSIDVASRLTPKVDGRVEVFLVTHHGSKEGSPKELLADIKPGVAVISAGAMNKHGHPTPETIDRLRAPAAMTERIYCTMVNGTVTATISTSGAISWKTTPGKQATPWWSRTGGQTGFCKGKE